MKCTECGSTDLMFTTTRTLIYKVDGVDEDGNLELGELIEEEEGEGDTLECLKCEHSWPYTPPEEDDEEE